jgi:hypothetical protein
MFDKNTYNAFSVAFDWSTFPMRISLAETYLGFNSWRQ